MVGKHVRRAIAAVAITLALASCSNTVDTRPVGHGQCEQTTRSKFIGITYSTDRNRLNCDAPSPG